MTEFSSFVGFIGQPADQSADASTTGGIRAIRARGTCGFAMDPLPEPDR
jgi:hypothetical protein